MNPLLTGYALHHVGIVVADIDAAVARYEALGFAGGERFAMTEQGVIAVTYRAGPGYVGADPADRPGGRHRPLHGQTGRRHAPRRLRGPRSPGHTRPVGGSRHPPDRRDARTGAHGWRIAFVHPESCNGVLTELVEADGDRQTLSS